MTVHDLIYRRYPEAHAGMRALGMRVLVPLAVRRSHRVIVDAEATRGDLVELLGVDRGADRCRAAWPRNAARARSRS